jgi:hypothetical protein
MMSIRLTFQTNHHNYVIKCPDGAQLRTEDGIKYAVIPSPFEDDDPGELLWLHEQLLILTARAGAWGFHLMSETALPKETAAAPRPTVLNGHKVPDPHARKPGDPAAPRLVASAVGTKPTRTASRRNACTPGVCGGAGD